MFIECEFFLSFFECVTTYRRLVENGKTLWHGSDEAFAVFSGEFDSIDPMITFHLPAMDAADRRLRPVVDCCLRNLDDLLTFSTQYSQKLRGVTRSCARFENRRCNSFRQTLRTVMRECPWPAKMVSFLRVGFEPNCGPSSLATMSIP